MYKTLSVLLKVLSIILMILVCIAVIYDEISRATLLAVLAFYSDYQANKYESKS